MVLTRPRGPVRLVRRRGPLDRSGVADLARRLEHLRHDLTQIDPEPFCCRHMDRVQGPQLTRHQHPGQVEDTVLRSMGQHHRLGEAIRIGSGRVDLLGDSPAVTPATHVLCIHAQRAGA